MPYWYDNYNLPYYTWVTTSVPASACPYCGNKTTVGYGYDDDYFKKIYFFDDYIRENYFSFAKLR